MESLIKTPTSSLYSRHSGKLTVERKLLCERQLSQVLKGSKEPLFGRLRKKIAVRMDSKNKSWKAKIDCRVVDQQKDQHG